MKNRPGSGFGGRISLENDTRLRTRRGSPVKHKRRRSQGAGPQTHAQALPEWSESSVPSGGSGTEEAYYRSQPGGPTFRYSGSDTEGDRDRAEDVCEPEYPDSSKALGGQSRAPQGLHGAHRAQIRAGDNRQGASWDMSVDLADPASAANKIEWLRAQLQQKALQVSQLFEQNQLLEQTLAKERGAMRQLNSENLSDLQRLQQMHAQQVEQLQLQLQSQNEAAQRAQQDLKVTLETRDSTRSALEDRIEVLEQERQRAETLVDAERAKVSFVDAIGDQSITTCTHAQYSFWLANKC